MNHAIADEPLYATSGVPVDGLVLEQLLLRQTPPIVSERKRRAWVAFDVYRGRLNRLIFDAVRLQQNSPTIREEMRKFVTAVRNDALDVAREVAVVWKNGAERRLGGDGDESDTTLTEQEQALHDLSVEAGLDELCEQINQLAWLQGPQFAVPLVRDGLLTIDLVGPHIYDIVQNEANPLGTPVAIAWHLCSNEYAPGEVEHQIHVLDEFTLRRFTVRGGQYRLEDEPLVHRYERNDRPRLPAACLRFSRPLAGDDWYLVDQQHRLTSGTIEVGVMLTRLSMVRKAQCHHLFTMVGDLSSVPKGQEVTDPETPKIADTGSRNRAGGAASVTFDVLDFNTPPDDTIKHVLFWVLSMVEPMGGHIQVDPGQPDIFGKIVIPPARQAEQRKRQRPAAMTFERDLWGAITAMVQAELHTAWATLPTPEEVWQRLRVSFGELTTALEDPATERDHENWKLSRGQTSEVRLMRARLGGATEAEAWRAIEQNMLDRAKFNELAARHHLSTSDDGSTQTISQALGAQGTPMREAIRAATAAQGDAVDGSAETTPEPT